MTNTRPRGSMSRGGAISRESIDCASALADAEVLVCRRRIAAGHRPQLWALAEVFRDATGVVVALVVLGLDLEIRAKGRTSQAIKKLIGLQVKTARGVGDGKEIDLPVEEVLVNDVVVVRPARRSRPTAGSSPGPAYGNHQVALASSDIESYP